MLLCKPVYKLNLPNRPHDEVFTTVNNFSRYLISNYGLLYGMIIAVHGTKLVH